MAVKKPSTTAAQPADANEHVAEQDAAKRAEAAEAATVQAKEEGRLPETMAVTNPAPATEMESPSGAFIEPEIKEAVPNEHPAVDNNPRADTSAVQNGGDFNDPRRRHPSDPNFEGQGLDLSVYGIQTKSED
ncbi:hypothetical protein [Devosia sp. MC521]|uniref:hypothetical protein n=1 Tax=Devosia sp. MC521 TaxID=2759954 RepID=UPI0015F8E501|nr:hypothetical protein [Devosia sp. MC521]MBJ6986937.1 hypothetical protein [Devosia sp. MC521]QMW63961.1 hypothetical protein H4N61_06495 [Devosia sp. MC521]